MVAVVACNSSIRSPQPVSSPSQPTPNIPTHSPDVISRATVSPSDSLTPTPSPESATSTDLPVCFDNMKILATFGSSGAEPAGILVAWPGEMVDLGWRIQNSGTCTWDSAYSFEQLNAGKLSTDITQSVTESSIDRVSPGKSIAVRFTISAPLSPGDYPISWVLFNGYRNPVGARLMATIHVPGDSLNQPLPTMTKNPNVQFEASSTQVAPYDRVALAWEVKQANKVYFYPTGQNWPPNQVPLKGERVYYPTIDTAYNLRVVNLDNTVESYKIEVIVEPPLGLPEIVHFELDPKGHVVLGSCVDISWRVRGGWLTEVSLYANDILLLSGADRTAEFSDCTLGVGLTVYTLVASGPGGTASKCKTIDVQP